MPYPKKKVLPSSVEDFLFDKPKDYLEQFKGKTFDEVLAMMANDETQKAQMASAIITQIKTTGDPSSLKILQASLERQGFSNQKELPISDARFIEIIKTIAREL